MERVIDIAQPLSQQNDAAGHGRGDSRWSVRGVFSIAFGMTLTLIVSGYQFGRGNLTVYLLDGMRVLHPELLRNDWFVTHTLQYHAVFSALTAALMRLRILQSAFLVGYLVLVLLWHVAWRGIVQAIGADDRTYLLSVVLFYLSAAGISIGVFQFLQDACFLPSNVANIAMLWAFYQWMRDRPFASGIWFGVAGLFHVNFAAMAIGMWIVLAAWQWQSAGWKWQQDRWWWWGTIALFVPSLFNLAMTVPDEIRHGGTMAMVDFVRIYVRFRHAHHFDPLHWPAALWGSFLWPIPLAAVAAMRWNHDESVRSDIDRARRRGERIFLIIAALLVIAFLFAGVWFVNEPLVQLCLWRFSIFTKLFSCVATAWLIVRSLRQHHLRLLYLTMLCMSVAALIVFWAVAGHFNGMVAQTAWTHRAALITIVFMLGIGAVNQMADGKGEQFYFQIFSIFAMLLLLIFGWGLLGVGMTPEPEDLRYRAVCAWAKRNTPIDSVFLVPPQETDFRLYAQRAIIINFKHVPQLSGEIEQWNQRLSLVLGPELAVLETSGLDYTQTMAALSALYESRSDDQLAAVATHFSARYIVLTHPLQARLMTLRFHEDANPFYVYEYIGKKRAL